MILWLFFRQPPSASIPSISSFSHIPNEFCQCISVLATKFTPSAEMLLIFDLDGQLAPPWGQPKLSGKLAGPITNGERSTLMSWCPWWVIVRIVVGELSHSFATRTFSEKEMFNSMSYIRDSSLSTYRRRRALQSGADQSHSYMWAGGAGGWGSTLLSKRGFCGFWRSPPPPPSINLA